MEMETRALSMVLADVCVESSDLMTALSSSGSDWDGHLEALTTHCFALVRHAFRLGLLLLRGLLLPRGEFDVDVVVLRLKSTIECLHVLGVGLIAGSGGTLITAPRETVRLHLLDEER